MNEHIQIEQIKDRLKTNAYFTNPLSDVNVTEDMRYLLALIENQQEKLERIQKKNEILSQHVLELTQEMENIKSDFGNNR